MNVNNFRDTIKPQGKEREKEREKERLAFSVLQAYQTSGLEMIFTLI